MTSTRPDGGPAIYRLAFNATPRDRGGADAIVAAAVDAVDAVTVVDRTATACFPGGVVQVEVRFRGINRNEAAETARRAMAAAAHLEPVDAGVLWLGVERVSEVSA